MVRFGELSRFKINNRGAIILGDTIVADGYEKGYRYRVVSHAHSDHLNDLSKSLKEIILLFGHKATFEILDVLNVSIPRDKIQEVDYGTRIRIDNTIVEFLRSKHILGSIQTLVTINDVKAVYTGDFKEPGSGSEIPECDVVIMEGTYGSPEYRRPFKDAVEDLLADFISELLSKGSIVIHAFYGKQQEVMSILRERDIDAPYIASQKVYKISKIAEKYGYKIGEIILENTREANEIIKDNWFIYFTHVNTNTSNRFKHSIHVYLTGWEYQMLYRQIDSNRYVFAFSDHADFEELIDYVELSKPKLVIVDAYRGGDNARKLANYIEKNLKIRSIAMPKE